MESVKRGSECVDVRSWLGETLGVVMHPASVNARYQNIYDQLHAQGCRIGALFGPQHGIFGETQDNMIEWEGFKDPKTGIPVYSLYGTHRTPAPNMLHGLDRLVIDLQDVGSRYYTFIWTMLNCMRSASEHGVAVSVLDRPNPINASTVEGPLLNMDYQSFVGLAPIPIRHGLTIGELALFFKLYFGLECDLEVIPMENYRRRYIYNEMGIPWVLPSPNMPHPETAQVYPGGCLLEATNLSEGRGTTLPFELLGAPFIDPNHLSDQMDQHKLPGVHFRKIHFQPTFHKWVGQLCHGFQVHVTDPSVFRPFATYAVLISEIKKLYPKEFKWLDPPYEYEYKKMPIDILTGNPEFREQVDREVDIRDWLSRQDELARDFQADTAGFQIYE